MRRNPRPNPNREHSMAKDDRVFTAAEKIKQPNFPEQKEKSFKMPATYISAKKPEKSGFMKNKNSLMDEPLSGEKIETPETPNIDDLISQEDLAGRSFTMTPEQYVKVLMKQGTDTSKQNAQMILAAPRIRPYRGKLLKFSFTKKGGIDKIINPETGEDITAPVDTEEPGDPNEIEITPSGEEEGYMCGGAVKEKGMAGGGPVEAPPEKPTETVDETIDATVEGEAAPAEKEGAEAPEGEDMTGLFDAYAKTEGVDAELVKTGNDLAKKLESAISGDTGEADFYLNELRKFARDVEAKKQAAKNDGVLAGAYKEMALDANDLISAYENLIADRGTSPEAQADRTLAKAKEQPA